MNNNYNFVTNTNHFLPSAYNYNTFSKINNIDNMAYIDVFCYYLFGNLSFKKYITIICFILWIYKWNRRL